MLVFSFSFFRHCPFKEKVILKLKDEQRNNIDTDNKDKESDKNDEKNKDKVNKKDNKDSNNDKNNNDD